MVAMPQIGRRLVHKRKERLVTTLAGVRGETVTLRHTV